MGLSRKEILTLQYHRLRKYFNISDQNKSTSEILDPKIKEKGLINEPSISNLGTNPDLNTKLVTLATKTELKAEKGKHFLLKLGILAVKAILIMVAHKIIQCFSQFLDISKNC